MVVLFWKQKDLTTPTCHRRNIEKILKVFHRLLVFLSVTDFTWYGLCLSIYNIPQLQFLTSNFWWYYMLLFKYWDFFYSQKSCVITKLSFYQGQPMNHWGYNLTTTMGPFENQIDKVLIKKYFSQFFKSMYLFTKTGSSPR